MKTNDAQNESKIDRHGSPGFIKFCRSSESEELLRDPLALGLLAVIASRARWRRTSFSVDGLGPGEALIGDYKKIGMTRGQYRTRCTRLVKWGLIAVQPTPKGTLARLTSTAVFDINIQPPERLTNQKPGKNQPACQPPDFRGKTGSNQPPGQPTSNQQTTNEQPLTNNERRKE